MILGQTLYTCLANKFEMPYSKIFSSITVADSLLEEKSYYFEEMRIIKEFIEESVSPEPCFFILDEIFKGTNTIERVSAGKAILSYLAKNNNLIFVSTHDTELNELLKTEYDLYHFSETVEEQELIFDHKIKKGPLKTRNAIKILEINDYPASVITDANATVDLLMQGGH
jgi:DNA mismatch repair ATPase MutS